MQADLQRAQAHLKAGRKAQAKQLLMPLCRAHPDQLEAWWLLALAVDDPKEQHYALHQVLRLDPWHEQAFLRLARLEDISPLPPVTPSTSGGGWAMLLGALGLIVAGVMGVLLGWGRPETAAPLEVNPMQTVVSQMAQPVESASPAPTLPPTWTPSPNPTQTLPVTLPPTWTPSASPTEPPPSATLFRTATPLPSATLTPYPTSTPRPTVNPAWYGQTYWDGTGDGETMDDYARNGRYMRHFDFPIYVFYDEGINQRWKNSVNYAINLLGTELPIRRTLDEAQADIRIRVLTPEDFMAIAPCASIPNAAGCGGIELIYNSQTQAYEAYGRILIRENAPIDTTLVVHEMIHALGIYVHSPNPDDVMYFSYTNQSDGLRLSERDKLIIRILYSLPAIGEN
jgi:hypothetical protein